VQARRAIPRRPGENDSALRAKKLQADIEPELRRPLGASQPVAPRKAPEDWRSPKPRGLREARARSRASVLDCASPLALLAKAGKKSSCAPAR